MDPTGEAAMKTQQTLTFYELDLGNNNVVRKYSEPLEEHANFLISVPGGNDGPSGVLICSENYLTYKNLGDQHDIRCPIPRRRVSAPINIMFLKLLGLKSPKLDQLAVTFLSRGKCQVNFGSAQISNVFAKHVCR